MVRRALTAEGSGKFTHGPAPVIAATSVCLAASGRRHKQPNRTDNQSMHRWDRLIAMTSSVERARAAFARQEWGEAFSAFTATAERAWLDATDQERLAVCAYLIGHDDVLR